MLRNSPSRLITSPSKRTTKRLLTGTVIAIAGREAKVRMPDGSVILMPVSMDTSLLGIGSLVQVQWGADSSPFVAAGGGGESSGALGINKLNIPSGEHTGVGELDYMLPDAHTIGVTMASALLNKQLAGVSMPSTSLYAGLMLSYTNDVIFAEVTATYFSNYKRAVVPRNTLMWPLTGSGETITNSITIGVDISGKPNSFLSSGLGCVLSTLPSIQINGVGLFDAQTGGNLWAGNKFLTPLTLKNGDVPGIQAGKLTIGFANQRLTQFEKRNFLNVAANNMDYTRPSYSIRFLLGDGWAEPTTAQWANYKPAVVYRDSTTFPPTTTKSIKNGIVIGSGAGGTTNSFFSSGNTAYIPGGALLVNAIGVYDHQNNACWRVPLANNEAATIKNGDPVFIDIGKLIFKIS